MTKRVPALLLLVALLATPSIAAQRHLLGKGSHAAVASGPGVDLVAWISNGRLLVSRIGASGVPAILSSVDLAPAPYPVRPAVVWDGATFVIATAAADGVRIHRIALEGLPLSTERAVRDAGNAPPSAIALASRGDGLALLAWSRQFGLVQSASLRAGVADEAITIRTLGANGGSLIDASADESGYLVAWSEAEPCVSTCPTMHRGIRQAPLDRSGLPLGSSDPASLNWMRALSLASDGDTSLLAFTPHGEPWTTRLRLSPSARWSAGAVPFAKPLTAEERDGTFTLSADGVRFALDETLRPTKAWWIPLRSDERTVGTLEASGRMVVESDTEVAIYAPSTKVADVALTVTWASAEERRMRIKIENRGPDAPEWTQLWVTGQVTRVTAALTRWELVHSTPEFSAIRLEGPLHKGTGWEVFLTFAPPFDPATAGIWYLSDGLDPDAMNGIVFPAIAMEEVPPARRRAVRR